MYKCKISPSRIYFRALDDVGKEYPYILVLEKLKGWKNCCENVNSDYQIFGVLSPRYFSMNSVIVLPDVPIL